MRSFYLLCCSSTQYSFNVNLTLPTYVYLAKIVNWIESAHKKPTFY